MRTMPVRWRVKQLLEDHSLSTYRLWKESGLAMGTSYRLVRGDTTSLNAETLDKVVGALRRLTGKPIGVQDLLDYEPPGVFVVHPEREVTDAVIDLVCRRHPSYYQRDVQESGADSVVESLLATWVKHGLAFTGEPEAEAFRDASDDRRGYSVHAVRASHVASAFREIGVIVDSADGQSKPHG